MKITYDILIALGDKYASGDLQIADQYGERGYSTDKQFLVFSNWNRYPKHILNRLERDCELEWSDEWIINHSSGKAYRTSPDSYSWTPSYWMDDNCEIWDQETVNKHTEAYIDLIKNDYDRVSLFKLPLEDLGFKLLDIDYESGWYHKNDNPKDILESLEKQYPKHDIIFTGLTNEQFRTNFKVAIRPQAND